MSKKLFITCPFSKLEPFIRKQYGELIYCMTLAGTDFYDDTQSKIEHIHHFIQQEQITDVFVVGDLDCSFLDNAMKNKIPKEWSFENIMEDLFLCQYNTVFKDKSKIMRKIKLSEMYVLYQTKKLAKELYYSKKYTSQELQIKGIMCCRSQELSKELSLRQIRYEF